MDDFNEIYEDWVDAINSQPLTTSRLNDFSDVLNVNQSIVDHIYSIRRHLELADDTYNRHSRRYHPYDMFNRRHNTYNNTNNPNMYNDNTTNVQNLLNTNLVTSLFSILLQGTDDLNIGNMEDVKVTLTDEQFDRLMNDTIDVNNKNEYVSIECNICMDEYNLGDNVVKLSCKHIFHKECIKNWLCNERVTCPVCRKDTREELET
jgi:hypothetical protein